MCFLNGNPVWFSSFTFQINRKYDKSYDFMTFVTFKIITFQPKFSVIFMFCLAANHAWGVHQNFPKLPWTWHPQSDPEDAARVLHKVRQNVKKAFLQMRIWGIHCFLRSSLCRNESPAVTLEILSSLASVRRFDMAVMFMSSSERKGVESLWCTITRVTFSLYIFHPQSPIILITVVLFCFIVLKELFDFLHQAELEESSVTALQKKYGVWRSSFKQQT